MLPYCQLFYYHLNAQCMHTQIHHICAHTHMQLPISSYQIGIYLVSLVVPNFGQLGDLEEKACLCMCLYICVCACVCVHVCVCMCVCVCVSILIPPLNSARLTVDLHLCQNKCDDIIMTFMLFLSPCITAKL